MEVVGMKAGTGVVQIKDCYAGVWRTGKKGGDLGSSCVSIVKAAR